MVHLSLLMSIMSVLIKVFYWSENKSKVLHPRFKDSYDEYVPFHLWIGWLLLSWRCTSSLIGCQWRRSCDWPSRKRENAGGQNMARAIGSEKTNGRWEARRGTGRKRREPSGGEEISSYILHSSTRLCSDIIGAENRKPHCKHPIQPFCILLRVAWARSTYSFPACTGWD